MNLTDEFVIEHYGKAGMKWGTRTNKAKNKASRARDKKKSNTTIDKARRNVDSGKTKREFKKAKDAHAANKAKLGTREARKILNEARLKKYDEVSISQQAKSGKETVMLVGAAGAFIVGYTALSLAARKY